MVNLDLYMDNTIDFMLKGELIKIPEPSAKMVKKMASLAETSESEMLDTQIKLITDILNTNTGGKKFKTSDIEELPQKILVTIMNTYTGSINETEKN